MTQDRTENSRAPPMRHHGFKRARRVSDTYKMCDFFILSCSKNVLIYRNIHFSKIYPCIFKLQQKFKLFWIFPRTLFIALYAQWCWASSCINIRLSPTPTNTNIYKCNKYMSMKNRNISHLVWDGGCKHYIQSDKS